jgi:hypothetical protein
VISFAHDDIVHLLYLNRSFISWLGKVKLLALGVSIDEESRGVFSRIEYLRSFLRTKSSLVYSKSSGLCVGKCRIDKVLR